MFTLILLRQQHRLKNNTLLHTITTMGELKINTKQLKDRLKKVAEKLFKQENKKVLPQLILQPCRDKQRFER